MQTYVHVMNRYQFPLLLLLGTLVYFSNLGGTSIYVLDEAKNAACAMEMHSRHDLIVPTFNGILRTDKPPLHYYFMMLSYSIFGVVPLAARFFSAFAGVLLIVFLYRNVVTWFGTNTAWISSVIVLSSIQLTIQFHLAVPDPYLILLLFGSLCSFYNGYHRDSSKIKWFYIYAGLGFLAKGLIAIVLPGMIVLIFITVTQPVRWATFARLRPFSGILWFCGIALPWYIAVGVQTNGAWLEGFFYEHNIERYTSTMEGHNGFPLAPLAILCLSLLPFSLFVIQAVKKAWIVRHTNPVLLFCLIVVGVFVAFFSFSKTILPSYPAPAIPFLAIIIGSYLSNVPIPERWDRVSVIMGIVISAGMIIAGWIVIRTDEILRDHLYLTAIFAILPIGSMLGLYFYNRKMKEHFVISWAGSWIGLGLLFFYVAYPVIDDSTPVIKSAQLINKDFAHSGIVAYKSFNPAYVFAFGRTFPVIDDTTKISQMIASGYSIVVITRAKNLEELKQYPALRIIFRGKEPFERRETVVLAN